MIILETLFKFIFLPFKLYFLSWKNFRVFLFSHLILLGSCIVIFYFSILFNLPDLSKLLNYQPYLETQFLDKNGKQIYSISEEKRIYVKISDIPKDLKNAFIAAEDKDFYSHSGFDVQGIIRAAIKDILKLNQKGRVSGGSTITQQVVKNIILTREKKITRKIKELILSYQASKVLTKDEILEIYLNHIYLGNKAYGVAAAAEIYFKKDLKDLKLEEIATIATLPQAPSEVNPFKHPEKCKIRRNWVLERMLKCNFIKESAYEEAIKNNLIVINNEKKDETGRLASWYAKKLFKDAYNLTDKDLSRDGFKIQLTIDENLQKISQKALDNNLIEIEKKLKKPFQVFQSIENINNENWKEELMKVKKPDNLCNLKMAIILKIDLKNGIIIGLENQKEGKIEINKLTSLFNLQENLKQENIIKSASKFLKIGDVIFVKELENNIYDLSPIPTLNGGVILINPKNGEILTMVGGYCDVPGALNRTTDAVRQTGSAIKAFVYSAALKNGILPSDIFVDSDLKFYSEDGTIWNPRNYTRNNIGPVTLRYALEHSVNTITIRVIEKIGIKKLVDFLKLLELNEKIDYDMSIGLGTLHTSLLNFTRAYSIFVNEGNLLDISLIKNVKKDNINFLNEKLFITKNQLLNIKKEEKEEEENLENEEKITDEKNIENKEEQNTREQKEEILDKRTAYQMYSILKGSAIRGTAHFLNKLNLPVGGKTGTSDKGKDLWFFFISKDLIGGVFIGADMPIETDLYGGSTAGVIANEILSEIKKDKLIQINPLKIPSGLKFIKLNIKTGERVSEKEEGTRKENEITDEAFKEEDNTSKLKIKNNNKNYIELDGEKLF